MVKLEAKRENLSTHIQYLIPISIKKIFRLKYFSFFFGHKSGNHTYKLISRFFFYKYK